MDLGRTLDCISDDPDYSKRYPDVKPSPSETSLKDFDEPDDRSLDDGKSFDDLRSYEEFRYDHVLGSSLPSIGTFKEGHVRPKSKSLVPPVAMALPKTLLEKDGVVVTDDYYWLRDRDNPKVLKYLEDENAYADIYMKNSKELMDSLYNEFCTRVGGDERSCYTQEDDFYYYTRINDEQQYQVHCRKFESLDNEEVIILDENKEAEGEDYYAMGPFEVSPDHCMLACGVDTAGDEKFTLLVKDLTTGKWLPEEIYPVGWTVRWAADNKTLFYTRVNEFGRSFQLYRHIIGENAPDGTDDELIYEEPDDRYILRITTTNNKKFFLMRVDGQITNEVWYLSTSQPRAQFQLFAPRTRGVMYFLASHGSWFYIQTNEGGSYNYKVVRSPTEDPSNRDLWEEVLPHREDVLIEQINLFRHHFVVWEWEGGLQKIRVQDLSDGEVHYVQLPEQLYSVWPGERRDEDDTLGVQYFNSNILRFSYTNFTQPIVVYDYDMDNWRKKKIKEVRVSGYIREHYHQKRIFAQASDGFMIPISLVYKISLKNSAGGNPVLLYGYGAYGGQILPEFNSERISLLDRGFIFAIAHVRGDATMGWKSYEQGKWFHKMNTFTDFIACAEHLINEGYTTVEKLAIHGRSAGGLLISAVVNLRPDLFQVAVLDVPFVDVIGSMMDRTIPWTPFEWEEWGNPNETDFFHYMLGYSPYHNLTAKEYPNLLITGGLNDPRVSYCEPAKYTAKLRKVKANNNALLLKTYLAGHMGSSGRFDHMEETAFTYAFILRHLTVEMPSTVPPNLMQVISPVAVTPPDLLAMFQGYQVTMLLCSALDLGVFNQLHRHADFKTDIATLAKALNVKKRGLKLLLNSLVAVGLLNQEEDQYQLSNIAVTHLVEGLPGYIGDLRFTLATDHQWTALRQLPQAIIQGHAVGAPQKQPLARVAQSNGKHAAATLVEVLAPWATRRKFISVLDIKCGNGILGFSLAKKRTNVRVWGLDTNDQLDITKEIAKEMDLNDRVSFIEKDIPCTDESFGGPYDLIIVGLNVLNGLGTVDAPVLIQQISDSLKSNGRVVFYEMISDVDPSPHAHLSSLSMFVTRRKGKIHSLGWFKDMLEDGGFVPPTVHNLQPFSEKLLVSYRNIISRKEKVKKPQ